MPATQSAVRRDRTIIGRWFAAPARAAACGHQVAGPRAAYPGCARVPARRRPDIRLVRRVASSRLQTDCIDLYQIHWPERHVPVFGHCTTSRPRETSQTSIHDQLQALAALVRPAKVRHRPVQRDAPWRA